MESRKSKGGTEKARTKKRKALETDAAKYAKIGNFFTKASLWFVTSDEDNETGKAICARKPLFKLYNYQVNKLCGTGAFNITFYNSNNSMT